jgi:glycine/D-amino acid oxidase-like deaminating enzyme
MHRNAQSDKSADVVVLGGGLVGSSAAYELACAGAAVTLLDASHPGRASDAGAGIVSPETFGDPDEDWFSFGLEAATHLRDLVARLNHDGVPVDSETFSKCGSLVVALAEHEDPWFTEALMLASRRSPDLREVDSDEARAMFPPLGPVWRAMHSPSAARVDGRRLRRAVRVAARRRGVRLVPAEGVEIERRGDRVTAISLPSGSVACGALVVATGAWSAATGNRLGAELPVSPTKGQIVHVRSAHERSGSSDPPSDRWPIVQPVLNFYLVPWPDGRVACGGTFEADAGFDCRPTAAGMRDLLRECVTIAPGLAEATFLEVRVGLRPTTADGRPLLGPLHDLANVHVCTGHGANGLLLGPYSAALVAQGLTAGSSPALAAYAAGRFSER